MLPDYKIPRKSIVSMMNKDYKAEKVTPHYKNETIFSGSTQYMFKLVVGKGGHDFDTYITIMDNLEEFQIPAINVHGNPLEIEKILIESGVVIKKVASEGIQWLNNFIHKVNGILLDQKFELYKEENIGDKLNQRIKSANTEFNLTINVVYYINEDLSVTERLCCQFSTIVYTNYVQTFKESIKFKLHGDDFITGSFYNKIENVANDFLEKKIKRTFLNYNKDIIKTYDLDINAKELFKTDDEFENLKELIKMIRY